MKQNAEALHHLARGAIVTGLALLVIRLSQTGDILLYIAPHLAVYAQIAAVGLLALGVYQFYFAVRSMRGHSPACACGHDHEGHSHPMPAGPMRITGLYGLFVLPLALCLAMPSSAFAGTIADSKGMNLGVGTTTAFNNGKEDAELIELEGDESPELRALFRSRAYDRDFAKLGMLLYQQETIEMKDDWFLEKLETINKFLDPFQGKSIEITGFVYRQEGLAEGLFIVGRMAMTHCIADIAPYGMIVEAPQASSFKDDQWVTVRGTIGRQSLGDREVMKVVADSVTEAKPASIPYVYPDRDFASKL
ncbi:TIGR03943 family putative permease subunit [Cohnella sp. GCM10020058]|uniref:TIGR03943 family putative permease subunit n=1 Tax=Cohnella sp. GCM10020058 TaxID=3317330 RepID=UPI0036408AC9